MKVNETPNLKLEIKIRKKYYCTYSNHWRIQGMPLRFASKFFYYHALFGTQFAK